MSTNTIKSEGFPNSSIVYLAAVYGANRKLVKQADLDSIRFAVTDTTDGKEIANGNLRIEEVVHDAAETNDSVWLKSHPGDNAGFNFEVEIPNTWFPAAGTTYRAVFTFRPTNGKDYEFLSVLEHTTDGTREPSEDSPALNKLRRFLRRAGEKIDTWMMRFLELATGYQVRMRQQPGEKGRLAQAIETDDTSVIDDIPKKKMLPTDPDTLDLIAELGKRIQGKDNDPVIKDVARDLFEGDEKKAASTLRQAYRYQWAWHPKHRHKPR